MGGAGRSPGPYPQDSLAWPARRQAQEGVPGQGSPAGGGQGGPWPLPGPGKTGEGAQSGYNITRPAMLRPWPHGSQPCPETPEQRSLD